MSAFYHSTQNPPFGGFCACICKPDSVEGQSFIWDVSYPTPQAALPSGPIGSRRTRPCTQVGILPFHFCVSTKLFPKPAYRQAGNSSPFGLDVTARIPILTNDGRYPLPSSILANGRVRTFLR